MPVTLAPESSRDGPSEAMDRRPLMTRRVRWIQRLAAWLARAGVSANAVSIAGLFAGAASGISFAITSHVDTDAWRRALFLAGAALVQLRLLCNLIDGLVAIEGNRRSPVGELYNEVPDRFTDAATLIGFGYALGGSPELGYLAAIAAILTAYVRAIGKSCGTGSDYGGPMAKPHRMMAVTLTALFCTAAPQAWILWPGASQTHPTLRGCGVVSLALFLITAGAALTFVLRLRRIATKLRGMKEISQ